MIILQFSVLKYNFGENSTFKKPKRFLFLPLTLFQEVPSLPKKESIGTEERQKRIHSRNVKSGFLFVLLSFFPSITATDIHHVSSSPVVKLVS